MTWKTQLYAALFYGSLQDNGGPQSNPNILNNGNLNWGGPGGDAGGVQTDQQGRGYLFQYWWPCCGGGNFDFSRYSANGNAGGVGRTEGLFRQANNDPQWPNISGSGNNIAVNPINSNQLLISSFTGRVYRTQDRALNWFDIGPVSGNQPQPLDGSLVRAMVYGAPDPALMGNATDDFIYAGTNNGNMFVTFNGGASWQNITQGLSGGSVRYIATNPARGSHEAYAVTSGGVFHIVDSRARFDSNPNNDADGQWTNITSNLFQLTHNIFGNPDFEDTQLRYLEALTVDWRYVLPDTVNAGGGTAPSNEFATHPVLYVGGDGGVFRSIDDGKSWTRFPAAEPNSLATTPTPPGAGGGLPNATVTDMRMSIGKIDPTTGRAVAAPGDPNILAAFTYGRGAFAIRLAPQVLPNSDTSPNNLQRLPSIAGLPIDADNQPIISGYSQQSAFGSRIYITLFDMTDPLNPRIIGGYDPANPATHVPANQTDSTGRFAIRLAAPLPDGEYVLGAQATDQAGLVGNIALLGSPDQPITIETSPDLIAATDSGRYDDDNLTNFNNNPTADPLNSPIFKVAAGDGPVTARLYRRPANPLTGLPTGPRVLVNTLTNATTTGGYIEIADTNGGNGKIPDGSYIYTTEVDSPGVIGAESDGLLVTIDSVVGAVAVPDLRDSSDTGSSNTDNITKKNSSLEFDVAGAETDARVELLRKAFGAPDVQYSVVNISSIGGATRLLTDPDTLTDGKYEYAAQQVDLAGNISTIGGSLVVTIDTVALKPSAPDLQPASDTPLPGQTGFVAGVTDIDNVTKAGSLTFNVAGVEDTALVELLRGGVVVASRTGPGALTDVNVPVPVAGFETYQYTARQLDVAGNQSTSGDALPVLVDRKAPDASAVPDLQSGSDTGNPNDNITSRTNLTFDVSTAEADALVELLRDGVVVASKRGPGPLTLDDKSVPSGIHDFVYRTRQTDLAGNTGPQSAGLTVRVDTTIPTAPATPDLLASSDSGKSDSDNVTNATSLVFQLDTTSETLVVELIRKPAGAPDTQYVVVSTFANATGLATDASVGDGVYDYAAWRVTAAGGRSAPSGSVRVTVDRVAPLVSGLTLLDDTGAIGDGRTSVRRPRMTGTVNEGGPVDVALQQVTGNGVTTPIGAAVATTGGFTVRPTNKLLNGTYLVRAQATDLAGNVGPAGSTLTLRIVSTPGDANADGLADFVTWTPGADWTTTKFNISISGGGAASATWGLPGDIPVWGDYDGDGQGDPAVFRPSTGRWFVLGTATGQPLYYDTWWGLPGDTPVPADYDGDGKLDLAVFRETEGKGIWYIKYSGGGQLHDESTGWWGLAGDKPVPADYNGDGLADLAIYRPATATAPVASWWIQPTTAGNPPTFNPAQRTMVPWGNAGDIPAPADFDGNGTADVAIYRPGPGTYWIRNQRVVTVRSGSDIPVPADYDGDGTADPAIYRAIPDNPSLWAIQQSKLGEKTLAFGQTGDIPMNSPFYMRRPPASASTTVRTAAVATASVTDSTLAVSVPVTSSATSNGSMKLPNATQVERLRRLRQLGLGWRFRG